MPGAKLALTGFGLAAQSEDGFARTLELGAASSWLSQGVQDSPYSLPQAWLGRLHIREFPAMLGWQWGGALLASWLVRRYVWGRILPSQ